MTRNCLDCGTPKFATIKVCGQCEKSTLDYRGPARKPLCHDCKHFDAIEGCTGLYYSFNPLKTVAYDHNRSAVTRAVKSVTTPRLTGPKVTLHLHDCEFFEASARDYKPSPHPLSYHDRLDIALYQFNPLAFWLDPHRWDHVSDPRQQAMGHRTPQAVLPMKKVGWVALAAAAVVFGLQRPKATQ